MTNYAIGDVLRARTTSGRLMRYRVIAVEGDGAWIARCRSNTKRAEFVAFNRIERDFEPQPLPDSPE